MEGMFKEGSIFSYMNTPKGLATVAVVVIILLALAIVTTITKQSITQIIARIVGFLFKLVGKRVGESERKYHRDLEIGKISEKKARVKVYRFLNDLTIDLDIKQYGTSPYELLVICVIVAVLITIVVVQVLFNNIWMAIPMMPIIFMMQMSILYTRANLAHDTRIENVIEAENIVCNNISKGVIVAVKDNLNVFPVKLRPIFQMFLDNIQFQNYHVEEALLELGSYLGSISDDFIKKCIAFQLKEERGMVGIFEDIVEVNNIKMKLRIDMKRQFEKVKSEFMMGALMIFIFLGAVIIIYPAVRDFYFKLPIGQIILAMDVLLFVSLFVYITYLRAKEL